MGSVGRSIAKSRDPWKVLSKAGPMILLLMNRPTEPISWTVYGVSHWQCTEHSVACTNACRTFSRNLAGRAQNILWCAPRHAGHSVACSLDEHRTFCGAHQGMQHIQSQPGRSQNILWRAPECKGDARNVTKIGPVHIFIRYLGFGLQTQYDYYILLYPEPYEESHLPTPEWKVS